MAKVAIVGSGAWGTALGAHAARLDHQVRMWALEPPVVEDVNARHVNTLFLPDVKLPESIRATGDPAEAVSGAELVVLVPPSKYLRGVSERIAPHLAPGALIVVATKAGCPPTSRSAPTA